MKRIIIVLLCFTLVLSSIGLTSADANDTIYVDDDGTADYTSIQDAVDVAFDGDTIFVYSGMYYENLQIDKSLTLTGEDKQNTIIDGNSIGNVVTVTADSVTIEGFTVKNGELWSAGIHVYDTHDTSISNCIVTSNNGIGIELDITRSALVSNCIISSNTQFGIVIYPSNGHRPNSNHNIVSSCVISDNDEGVFLDDTTGNSIIENQITDNHVYGINLVFTEGNVVERNNLIDNNKNAYFQGIYGNSWSNNYWSDYINIGVKIIFGKVFVFPWLNFDWNPATEPYDIGGD